MQPQWSISPRRRSRFARRVTWIVAALVSAAVLGSFGISFYVGWNLTHPKRVAVTTTPAAVGLPYQDIEFPSRIDHVQLQGWWIPAASPTDRVVIFAHGYRGNRAKDEPALPTMKALHDKGFNVIAFDFRDEGRSPGSEVSVGYFEVRDLLGAVDYAKRKGAAAIGIIGFSMGASTALEAAADDPDVRAVIADSPFANLYNYLVDNMPVWTHLPNWPFTGEILWETRVFEGLDARAVDPLDHLRTWQPRPLLLIAGTADHTIPMQNSEQLYEVVKGNPGAQLWIVPGADHVGAYKVAPAAYESRVTSFFDTYLH